MPIVPDADLREMCRILRACADYFSRAEIAERRRIANDALSLVEMRDAQASAERYKAFVAACGKYAYAVPDD